MVDGSWRLRSERTYGCGEVDASLVLPLIADVGRLLVQPDAEPLQLVFDELLVAQRLQDVEHDEDQVAGPSHWRRRRRRRRGRRIRPLGHKLRPFPSYRVLSFAYKQHWVDLPAMTCLPLPLPSLAPSMIPGRSRSLGNKMIHSSTCQYYPLFKGNRCSKCVPVFWLPCSEWPRAP